jgi:L-alanine-DL-glutamate epimerase-like enolase superfamily enzyme
MLRLQLRRYRLQLRHRFQISRDAYDEQESLIVALSSGDQTGYGETTANPYYGMDADLMENEIESVRHEIESYKFEDPASFHNFLSNLSLPPFILCALDLAAWDLYGKKLGKPLYELWGTTTDYYPITNYTIGLDTVDNMIAKMKEKPWPIYKIKLGTDQDIAIIRELRTQTTAVFRIDANCAWTAQQTINYAPVLKELGVEFIEQPLAAEDWEGMEIVQHRTVLPIIADESCRTEEDVDRCALHFNGINIKLTKCGGLTPALRMIKKARELGLKIMVGCMTESTVGISAIAQLLPQLDFVDMDGALLLKEDIATGVELLPGGKVKFPELGGSGIQLL